MQHWWQHIDIGPPVFIAKWCHKRETLWLCHDPFTDFSCEKGWEYYMFKFNLPPTINMHSCMYAGCLVGSIRKVVLSQEREWSSLINVRILKTNVCFQKVFALFVWVNDQSKGKGQVNYACSQFINLKYVNLNMSPYYIAKWFGLKGSCTLLCPHLLIYKIKSSKFQITNLEFISKKERRKKYDIMQAREQMAKFLKQGTCWGIRRASWRHCCYVCHFSQHVALIMYNSLLLHRLTLASWLNFFQLKKTPWAAIKKGRFTFHIRSLSLHVSLSAGRVWHDVNFRLSTTPQIQILDIC